MEAGASVKRGTVPAELPRFKRGVRRPSLFEAVFERLPC